MRAEAEDRAATAAASPVRGEHQRRAHHWLDFAEFLRVQVDWGVLGQGLAVQGAWVAIFGTLAWSRFTTADVTS